MRFHLDPTFRFHARCALLIAMSAAFVTLFGALYFGIERMNDLAASQRGFEADALRLQAQLNRQRVSSDSEIAGIKSQLVAMGARQDAGDARASAAGTRAPFPIGSVLGSVVELVCIDGRDASTYYTGSGTVVDPRGLIVTNRHVLVSGDGTLIRYCGVGFTEDIQSAPRIAYVATAVATREASDLALLQITEHVDGAPLPSSFASIDVAHAREAARALQIGDPVYIGGYPGLGAETFTFTQGVVSGRVGDELIKTSALIDSGASGGAAFSASGAFVGIPTAATRGDIGGSLGYVLGANVVQDFLDDYARLKAGN